MPPSTFFIGPMVTGTSSFPKSRIRQSLAKKPKKFTFILALLTSTYVSGSLVQSHLLCHFCSSWPPPQLPISFGIKAVGSLLTPPDLLWRIFLFCSLQVVALGSQSGTTAQRSPLALLNALPFQPPGARQSHSTGEEGFLGHVTPTRLRSVKPRGINKTLPESWHLRRRIFTLQACTCIPAPKSSSGFLDHHLLKTRSELQRSHLSVLTLNSSCSKTCSQIYSFFVKVFSYCGTLPDRLEVLPQLLTNFIEPYVSW